MRPGAPAPATTDSICPPWQSISSSAVSQFTRLNSAPCSSTLMTAVSQPAATRTASWPSSVTFPPPDFSGAAPSTNVTFELARSAASKAVTVCRLCTRKSLASSNPPRTAGLSAGSIERISAAASAVCATPAADKTAAIRRSRSASPSSSAAASDGVRSNPTSIPDRAASSPANAGHSAALARHSSNNRGCTPGSAAASNAGASIPAAAQLAPRPGGRTS